MSEVVPVGAWSNRPRVLLGLGLFWAGEALLGVGLGVVMVSEGRGMPGWMLGVALFFAVFLAAVGLRLSVWCLGQLGVAGTVLAIGPAGYFDRRLCPQTIPWEAVSRVDIYYAKGVQLMFDLAGPANARVRRFPRALARLNRAVGLPGYSVSLMGTDADAVAVAKAMHGWHVAARAGASAAGADPA